MALPRLRGTACGLVALVTLGVTAGAAQANPFSDSLLQRIRAAAAMVPGPKPEAVRVYRFGATEMPESELLKDGGKQPIPVVYTVFQLQFADGWIMVDAGMDPEVAADTTAAYRTQHELVQKALLGARSIVVTHEHHDHVGGVVRSPSLNVLAPKTLLNRAQVQTLRDHPNVPLIRVSAGAAQRYTVIDYDLLFPLAPGVVLIRSPGHTPGSQMVYVATLSGSEMLLIGDVAWAMAGVEQRRQKPDAEIKSMNEDVPALQAELDWLNGISARTSVAVVPGHDDRWLSKMIERGVLNDGLDLR